MRKLWIESVLNVLFWLLSGWLIVSAFSIEVHEIEIINGEETVHIERSATMVVALLQLLAICLLLFYSNLFIIRSLQSQPRKTRVVVGAFLLFAASYVIHQVAELVTVPELASPLPMGLSTGLLLFYFSVSTAYGVGKVWVSGEHQRQQLALEKKQSELNLLRNQLQPHFLFNVLNGLLSMVDQRDNPQLAKSIGRLSGMLRYVVDETNAGSVPVEREINFLENYADLQLLRFGEGEVHFSLEVTGKYRDQPLEPGLFLPFLENAFRYGAEPESQSRIAVEVDVSEPHIVRFAVSNPVYPQLRTHRCGTGITSVKRRLALVYPDRHELQIDEKDHFRVELKLQTDARDHR